MAKQHELNLHENIIVNTGTGRGGKQLDYRVTRVPGGWMYKDVYSDVHLYVPFSKEFSKEQ